MGRRWLRLMGSAPGFSSVGVMAADLRNAGKIPNI